MHEKISIKKYSAEKIYLYIIGIATELQGQGFGGTLLRTLIENCATSGTHIYLETEIPDNVKLYEKFGFTAMKKLILPEPLNLPMWLMVRNHS